MTTFVNAVKNTLVETSTYNGMATYESSLNECVNLFFVIGSSRDKDITVQFEKAFQENALTALRIVAWARDIRDGAGERQTYRNLLKYIEQFHPSCVEMMVQIIPIVGRFDDLFVFDTTAAKQLAYSVFKEHLIDKKSMLAAKWAPREKSANKKIALELIKFLKLSPKSYRKLIADLSETVEDKLCAHQYSDINYSHVPSIAASRYQATFKRHDEVRYKQYKLDLATGANDAKINANAIFPHDVIRHIENTNGIDIDLDIIKAQWDALPNYIGDAMVLPMCDVSGSMGCAIDKSGLTAMQVSISLGMYLADKNTGPFKDCFLTFSEKSKINVLSGNILEKYRQLSEADWGMNTNLESAFDEILRVATTNKVPESEMPKYLIVFSDMEFDEASVDGKSVNAITLAGKLFADNGYSLPKIIWWNLNARDGNVPVKYDHAGTALVSGFSPSLLKSILKTDDLTPINIMKQTVNVEKYTSVIY
jgi:hypothetical protein